VAKKHGVTEDMLAAGWAVCVRLEVATPGGVPRGNNASHYIDDLAELKGLLREH
jgi:hypothetical protein